MILTCKINHSNEISLFNLVKNEVFYKILGLFCQQLKIQDDGSVNPVYLKK